MKHLKDFNLYNEGLFNYIRSKRFKDDDIVQNIIKIIKKANPKDIDINLIDERHEGDVLYSFSVITYDVLVNKDIKFEITRKKTENISFHDMADGIERSNEYKIKIDELNLISGIDISNSNIEKLYNIIDNIHNTTSNTSINDDAELMKSTLKKELKFKAKR
jgi:hypothetical protein